MWHIIELLPFIVRLDILIGLHHGLCVVGVVNVVGVAVVLVRGIVTWAFLCCHNISKEQVCHLPMRGQTSALSNALFGRTRSKSCKSIN